MRMKVLKRGLAAFLAIVLLMPGRASMVANASPLESVETQISEGTAVEERLQEQKQEEFEESEISEMESKEESLREDLIPTTEDVTDEEEDSLKDSLPVESTVTDESRTVDESGNDFHELESTEALVDSENAIQTIIWENVAKLLENKEPEEELFTATPNNAEKASESRDESGDRIGFNTGNHTFYVVSREEFEEGLGDVCFSEDGSYTINIPEENPFFPYEIQFIHEDKVFDKWFMTPDDHVIVGGHEFYVSASFDGTAVTQMSFNVAGDTVVVYPEKKTFKDGNGIMELSLLPLEERKFTVSLKDYTPVDLTRVSLDTVFTGNAQLNDTDKIMWSYGEDGNDYTISQVGDVINMSRETMYGHPSWQMIVGNDNQLDAGNIRYIIHLDINASRQWLKPKVYKQDGEGQRTEVAITKSYYDDSPSPYEDPEESRGLNIYTSTRELDRQSNAYVGLEIDESLYGNVRYDSLRVYKGREIADGADITEQVFAQDMTQMDAGYLLPEDAWITIVAYDASGNVIGSLPLELDLNRSDNEIYVSGIYDYDESSGQWKDIVQSRFHSSDSNGCEMRTSKLYYGYTVDKEYHMRFRYEKAGWIIDSDEVTAAYVGRYSSIAEAVNAGAGNIKDTLFGLDGGKGYKANYSTGIYFTVFVGEDDSGKQEIYQLLIKVEEGEPEEPVLNYSTSIRFTGLKDANGADIDPCYVINAEEDSYGDNSYRTLLVGKDVDLTNVAPVFKIDDEGINLYAKGSKKPEISGISLHDFSGGPIHYTAGSESKTEQQNYWLQIVKQTGTEGKIYINSLEDERSNTRIVDGVTYSTREMVLDGYFNYSHDILLINTGENPITDLIAELESNDVELDPYWTLKGEQNLSGFDKLESDKAFGQLANFAKLRIKAKGDVSDRRNVSGTLTIKSGNDILMVLTLTGTIGDPYITTDELWDAVKYVPYGFMIQNNNKYNWNRVSYSLKSGTLPEGMGLYMNGELYGVPKEYGEFTFTVEMKNSGGGRDMKPSEKTFTLTVLDNTNLNVYNTSDEGYSILEHIGQEVGAGSRDYVLSTINDQLYVSSGEYGEFIALWLNGEKLVAEEDYTKESGSTRITIRKQTLVSKLREGTNTIAAEFRVEGKRDKDLKRTAQNFRIGSLQSSGGTVSGGSSSSSSSNSGGYAGKPTITYDSKKGNVHIRNGIITGQGAGYSHWQQDENGWKLIYANGTTAVGHLTTLEDGRTVEQILWEKINGSWYAFGLNGYLKSGWVFDHQLNAWYNVSVENGMQGGWYTDSQDQQTYYLDPNAGNLTTGWRSIDDKWYYFNALTLGSTWKLDEETGKWNYDVKSKLKPFGAMFKSEKTPDGYFVGSDGVWDGKEP